jgi:hypothetical protein
MASKSGGGSTSRNVVRPGMRNGQPSTRINPRGVSQIGSSMSNHSMDSSGKKLTKSVEPVRGASMPGVKLGNEVAKNVGGGGPGAGRQVMGSGTQGQHGPVAPGNPPPAGELFPGWPAKK